MKMYPQSVPSKGTGFLRLSAAMLVGRLSSLITDHYFNAYQSRVSFWAILFLFTETSTSKAGREERDLGPRSKNMPHCLPFRQQSHKELGLVCIFDIGILGNL